jgi:hypothetical protein
MTSVTLNGTIKVLETGLSTDEFTLLPSSAKDKDDWYWLVVPPDKADYVKSLDGLTVKADVNWKGMIASRAKFELLDIQKS